MMDCSVPILSSLWSGTMTVTVEPAPRFCIATWLPLRRASEKPCVSRMRQASRPDRTRSLANSNLEASNQDFCVQALPDFAGRGGL